jgi:hypothetical protein
LPEAVIAPELTAARVVAPPTERVEPIATAFGICKDAMIYIQWEGRIFIGLYLNVVQMKA